MQTFETLVGFLCFLSFNGALVCAALVKRHVSSDGAQPLEGVGDFFKNGWFLPRRLLTETGNKLALARNVLFFASLTSLGAYAILRWIAVKSF